MIFDISRFTLLLLRFNAIFGLCKYLCASNSISHSFQSIFLDRRTFAMVLRTVDFVMRYYRYQSASAVWLCRRSDQTNRMYAMQAPKVKRSKWFWAEKSGNIEIKVLSWRFMRMVFGSHERDCDNKELIYIVDLIAYGMCSLWNSIRFWMQMREYTVCSKCSKQCTWMVFNYIVRKRRRWDWEYGSDSFSVYMLISWMMCGLAHIFLMCIRLRNDGENIFVCLHLSFHAKNKRNATENHFFRVVLPLWMGSSSMCLT